MTPVAHGVWRVTPHERRTHHGRSPALPGCFGREPTPRADRAGTTRSICSPITAVMYESALPPVNLQPEEMLDAVVERLLQAMRSVRPHTVRQFFALVNQHMRWELNDVARRLDEQPNPVELQEEMVQAPASSDSALTPVGRRMLDAIDKLPEDE